MAKSFQDVVDQMAEAGIAGLMACDLVADGKYHRFKPDSEKKKKKSGWYILFEHQTASGQQVINGAYGMGPDAFKVQVSDAGWSVEDRADFAAKRKAAEKAAAEARKSEGQKAAEKAARLWAVGREEGASAYLDRKAVRAFGLRFLNGSLLVPVRNATGALLGCQYIGADGSKRFNTGMVKDGGFHILGDAATPARLLLAEGYATAASLHMATGWPVVVCFDAGNIAPVAATLRLLYPNTEFVFCGDDDRHLRRRLRRRLEEIGAPADLEPDGSALVVPTQAGDMRIRAEWAGSADLPSIRLIVRRASGPDREWILENAGRKAAMAGAKKFGGVAVFPSFSAADADGTDFNDLHLAEGLGIVRSQVLNSLQAAKTSPPAEKTLPGKAEKAGVPPDELKFLLEHLVMLYGATVTIWDASYRQIVKPESLELVYGPAAAVWKKHPQRKVVRNADLVFSPSGKLEPGQVNMFEGLPIKPDGRKSCGRLVSLLYSLCGEDDGLFEWVSRWLAFPLQNPGAKMHTALIFHGRLEGTGKTLFFSAIREIYGRFSTVIGQHQLNSPYSAWMSNKLFALAEEVLTQQEKKLQKGYIKHLVSNDVLQIEEKFLPLREERNMCQFVFLSNEIQPMALDEFDRRYTVGYCDNILPKEDYVAIKAEIEQGGAAALYQWLLDVDLADFSVAAKPFDNTARRRLITLGLTPERKFIQLWRMGLLDAPYCSCLADDLYQAFRAFCRVTGERFIQSQTAFGGYLSAEFVGRDGVLKKDRTRVKYLKPLAADPTDGQKTVYFVPRLNENGERTMANAEAFLNNDIQTFARAMWTMAEAARKVVM